MWGCEVNCAVLCCLGQIHSSRLVMAGILCVCVCVCVYIYVYVCIYVYVYINKSLRRVLEGLISHTLVSYYYIQMLVQLS